MLAVQNGRTKIRREILSWFDFSRKKYLPSDPGCDKTGFVRVKPIDKFMISKSFVKERERERERETKCDLTRNKR